ncbi:Cytosolic phospholipase A2 beta [Bagarius yarrelli]|uniref:Phospholipase A2 n=1 Tax=Bagarius yarrelli TaxID=175774 RepID=A0A556V4M4_BAGYA|nr:Cytosolic phospholipase A2 beta [Bagarius yarrelli]
MYQFVYNDACTAPYPPTVSQPDLYVTLRLPTACACTLKTKVIQNNKTPEWNETFHFRVYSQLKNILEIYVYDEEIMQDEECSEILFDISTLTLGRKETKVFDLDNEAAPMATMEVKLDNKSSDCEKDLLLKIPGAHCENQLLPLSEDSRSLPTLHYHINKHLETKIQLQVEDEILNEAPLNPLKAKKEFTVTLPVEEVPTVALVMSGGSTRSMTGMYGFVKGLQKLGLLDAVSYITAVSGSTWSTASLYSDAFWSNSLDKIIALSQKELSKNVASLFTPKQLYSYRSELQNREKEGHFTSKVETWGLIIEYLIFGKKHPGKLSDQKKAVSEGQNPLPIYTAINTKKETCGTAVPEWCEFTPYEVGFPKYGAFVPVEHFGSEFYLGHVVKEIPETRVSFLLGMWSSFFSANLSQLWTACTGSMPSWASRLGDRVDRIESDDKATTLDTIRIKPEASRMNTLLNSAPIISNVFNFLRGFSLHNTYNEQPGFNTCDDAHPDSFPNKLTPADPILNMVDAGFAINTAFTPVLRPNRRADVILCLNYSWVEDHLMCVKATQKYCNEHKLPFPKIDFNKYKSQPKKEAYVFEDESNPDAPIVVLFPLVNASFKEFKEPVSKPDLYVTLHLPTACACTMKTKIIRNSKTPEWNETFHFHVYSQLKNILEINMYDRDPLKDEKCANILFDISTLTPGWKETKVFVMDDEAAPMATVEVTLDNKSSDCEKDLLLKIPGAHCETQVLPLSEDSRSLPTLHYHINKHLETKIQLQVEDETMNKAVNPLKAKKEITVTLPVEEDSQWMSAIQVFVTAITAFHSSVEGQSVGKHPLVKLALAKFHRMQGDYIPHALPSVPPRDLKVVLRTLAKIVSVSVWVSNLLFVCNVFRPAEDMKVRLDFDIPPEEKEFLVKRKIVAAKALQKVFNLETPLDDSQVPTVALVLSGGGTRAMTGMYGLLKGLQNLELLDAVSYMTSLSGSTWSTASLYADASWSKDGLDKTIAFSQKELSKSTASLFSPKQLHSYRTELQNREKEGHINSAMETWGLIIEYLIFGKKHPGKLSDYRKAVSEGQNPLPIYTAINTKKETCGTAVPEWCEFTPYEVGFPKYGAFVPVEQFGSKFYLGHVVQELPETRVSIMLGMWSSVFSASLSQLWAAFTGSVPSWASRFGDRVDRIDTHPDSFPNKLTPADPILNMVDAAFAIKTPFDPVLRPRRKADVILCLDYSWAKDHLLSLKETQKYCNEHKLPFPKIDFNKYKSQPKEEAYVFEDESNPDAPIVVLFPLVNASFKEFKEPGVKRSGKKDMEDGNIDVSSSRSPYATSHLTYTPEDFQKLLNLTNYNVLNNEEHITYALKKALNKKGLRLMD